eukprot:5049638-Amphidinium_carterae.1
MQAKTPSLGTLAGHGQPLYDNRVITSASALRAWLKNSDARLSFSVTQLDRRCEIPMSSKGALVKSDVGIATTALNRPNFAFPLQPISLAPAVDVCVCLTMPRNEETARLWQMVS